MDKRDKWINELLSINAHRHQLDSHRWVSKLTSHDLSDAMKKKTDNVMKWVQKASMSNEKPYIMTVCEIKETNTFPNEFFPLQNRSIKR